jgi:epoxyqueuosine reductase QueG
MMVRDEMWMDITMNGISALLKNELTESGASLVGFADLGGISPGDMSSGVSVAVAIPREIVVSIHDGPNMEYYDAYHEINAKLDSIIQRGEELLTSMGYKAHAQTLTRVKEFGNYRTILPHKTVATRAGLGWIGKCALLVTESFGSAVRISSLITNAPLECGEPVTASRCGGCTVCVQACPAKAASGLLWDADLDRDIFFDVAACRSKARELSKTLLDKEITLCGKCIEACPYTQKYLKNAQ